MKLLMLIVFLTSLFAVTNGKFFKKLQIKAKWRTKIILDGPLFFTKYIEKGHTDIARLCSRCKNLPNAPLLESYSGFITVNKEYNSNLFFWFFPALNTNSSAPVILWLQGGPGRSGLFGLFVENGPFIIQPNLTAVLREYTWIQTFHMIYVDNPVGSGFSFTDNETGYVTSHEQMAVDMFEFLEQFFILFPEYQNNEFYIAGQSYAGKWVSSLAHKIHLKGPSAPVNLTGIMIGNGYCHPETMVRFSDYLYNIGLVDKKQATAMEKLKDELVENIKQEEYNESLVYLESRLLKLLNNFTGLNYYYNYLLTEAPEDISYFEDYVNLQEFKKAVHVGNKKFQDLSVVQYYLRPDFYRSVKPIVSVIMDNYRVLFYTGQLDAIVPYPTVLNFIETIDWKYAQEYKTADRNIWYLKNSSKIAGYVHNIEDFYEVLVRNAGHEVPYDQPEVALDLISKFVNKEEYF